MRISVLDLLSVYNFAKICSGWYLPPSKFIIDFSHFYTRSAVLHYLPNGKSSGGVNYVKSLSNAELPVSLVPQHVFASRNVTMDEDLIVFVIDENDAIGSVLMLQKIFNNRLRTSVEVWLIDISAFESSNNWKLALNGILFDLNDDVLIYSHDNDTNIFHVWEVYKTDPKCELIILNHGNWSASDGLKLTKDKKWKRRRDLQGHHFKVVSLPDPPYIENMIPVGNGTFKMEGGLFAEVFDALKEVMNFTYTVRKPPDRSWGSIKSDNSWNGMVGMLAAQTADIGVTAFIVTLGRSSVNSFSHPLSKSYCSVFIKNPVGTYNFGAYTEPLAYLSWIAIIILCIAVPPVVFLIIRESKPSPAMHGFTLINSYAFLTGSLTLKSWHCTPKNTATRWAFFCISFFGMMLHWHWVAMLISYLSTRDIVLPFHSIAEMVKTNDYRLYVQHGTAQEDTFKMSTDPDWKKAWNEKIEPFMEEYKNIKASKEAIEFAVQSNPTLAVYWDGFAVSTYPEYLNCELIATPAKYDFKPLSYGFQKDSPYLDLFNYMIKDLKEKGSYDKIAANYEPEPQFCPDTSGQSLGFDSCITLYLIIIAGFSACICLLLIECLLHYLLPDITWFSTIPPEESETDPKYNYIRELELKIKHLETQMTNENVDLTAKMFSVHRIPARRQHCSNAETWEYKD